MLKPRKEMESMLCQEAAPVTDWRGCYDLRWQNEIVADAFTHPAKFSRSLIARIYQHAIGQGWLRAGDTVIDPFGGVALGGLDAAIAGVRWIGCELEPKFVELGNRNIALWADTYATFPKFVRPVLVNGDSRRLRASIAAAADLVVSSPPYAGSLKSQKDGIDWDKAQQNGPNGEEHWKGKSCHADYGGSPGNLASLPEGKFDLAVSSPPYAVINSGSGGLNHKPAKEPGQQSGRDPGAASQVANPRYGESPGQLSKLPEGSVDAAISSPPFERGAHGGVPSTRVKFIPTHGKGHPATPEADRRKMERDSQRTYGQTPGNIGNESSETFWGASRLILEEVFALLRPGGHAIWVCKNFVRKKKEVDFCGNWQRLAEAVGFRTVSLHRAWLVESRGTQKLLGGGEHTDTRERKSFFRRLAEKKGSPRIDWELVIYQEKL